MNDKDLKIAVFIDFDNIEIGVKTTLGGHFDVGAVLEALKERGEVVSKTAYGDWKRSDEYSRSLSQHAIKMVQRNLTPGGDKNGADINLALDALEMAFAHGHINAFVIVGGDSDFITLVEKLKQYDKKVIVVGGRAFTSTILQRNCHEFIAYENLAGTQSARRRTQRGRPGGLAPLAQVFPLVRRALKVLSDREVSPQLGLLKSTLLQLDSTFSERTYGASSFRDFAEKLAAAGLVSIKTTGRNIQVELIDGGVVAPEGTAEAAEPAAPGAPAPDAAVSPPLAPAGGVADGIREIRRLFEGATTTPRWPLYVRQVKQLLRSTDRAFDERRYGVESLVELLRGCQREGVVRLERDRRGVMRVYPGEGIGTPVAPLVAPPVEASADVDAPESGAHAVDETGDVGFGGPELDAGAGTDTTPRVADPAREEPAEAPPATGAGKGKRKTTRSRKTTAAGRTRKTAKRSTKASPDKAVAEKPARPRKRTAKSRPETA